MKRNTLCKRDYVLEILFWGIISFIWYQNLFFINIPGKTVPESNLILIVMVVVSVTVNLVFTIRWSRNTVSAITATLLPYGAYAYITYAKYMAKIYRIVLWVAVGICVLVALYIAVAKMNARTKSRLVFRKVRMTYSVVRFVGAAASVILIICLFCRLYIGGALITPGEKAASAYGEQYTIAANIDTVLLLQEEEWEKLDLDERMDVLQCICDIEGNYLGLDRGIHIYASKLDDNLLGYYNDSASSIQISIDLVESEDPHESLDCVCHEMFHAGQARYVEIYEGLDDEAKRSYFLYNASVYAEEFRDYKNARMSDDVSDYLEYYGQWCEQDAREYAYKAVLDYYERINDYFEQHGNNLNE